MSRNTGPGGPVDYSAILAQLRSRAEAAEAEVERLKQGLYPLTQWTIEQATQLADRIGTSEGSLFVAWINERKRADAAEAEVERLAAVEAHRDTLVAMIQRLEKFLSETGEIVSWKHGAVHTAIDLIKDLRERLEAVGV